MGEFRARGTGASRRIAEFVDELIGVELTERLTSVAAARVSDTVGVGIAGSATDVAARVRHACQQLAPEHPDGAAVWGTGMLLPPAQAALANAAAVHSEDYDDTHTAGVVHGSTCVVPAAWAAAENRDLTLSDVWRGVVAGWEVAARIGIASSGAFHRRGLHTTSVAGVFGAAVAAAAVWNLNQDQIIAALGLAGSAAGGLNVYLQDGTQGKLLNPAFAAQAGVQAAALAAAGVSGPAHVFEGRLGLFHALGEGPTGVESAMATLGTEWEIEHVSVKPYPVCHFSHATIDAICQLRAEGVRAVDVREIRCRLPEATWDLLCRPWESKLEPESIYAIRFSIPWLIGLALLDGDITRQSFTQAVLHREDVREVARKVMVEGWTDSPYPATFPGSVTLVLHDGRSLQASRLVNRGHPSEPLGVAELRTKFTACVSDVIGAGHAADAIATLAKGSEPVRPLARILSS